ncbi:CIS tube protein [Thermogemmatispora tikiterensis]|uniref:Peptidoglycan-binding protein n=1 Tax=Thermogemmatispora tikiterensis TaxID=1825093 RepID=A0A328VKT1_9CHLR|nr:peptidoglycan-binding protein [Thermogemmatispora tikiterensis]RAQ97521.1 peptidoglycan-binding protein [Thermogemmatispora tikiterensis]
MQSSPLALATIVDHDHGSSVECMFNPKEYTFSKQNSWTAKESKGTNIARLEFGSGQPTTLQMQLFFDTYTNIKSNGQGSGSKDVRKAYTEKIWNMMKVDPALGPLGGRGGGAKHKKGRPPVVSFQWGAVWSFKAVITNIRERFTLFLPDGTPVRSTLDVTFQQVQDKDDYPATNPTSGGVGGERVWRVCEGDTLAWIAYKEYGDPNLWRLVAEANRLTRVRQLTPGLLLEIPNATE